jgi:CRISPR-associated endonuclease/helicase Cas3
VLDVVACAQILLTEICPGRLDALANALGLSQEGTLPWLLFSIALHDLGKATPPFQGKVPDRKEALVPLGFDFPDVDEPHGSLSALLAPAELERYGCPPRLARGLARSVGAHHGDFASLEHLTTLCDDLARQAGRKPLWAHVRAELVSALAHLTGVSAAPPPRMPDTKAAHNSMLADLAGLTTVADWVGSNADIFGYVDPPESPAAYYADALGLARRALADAGFRRPPRPSARGFQELFGKSPWPLHDAIAGIVTELSPGALVIVEAPMGEGKTEAALLVYDTLAARGAEGLYFALPTQATSNQILGRVERYLAASFRRETHGLHLVHGGAGLSDRYGELKRRAFFSVSSIGDVANRSGDQGPIADAWFARPKRALLAPIAVGTVDQALFGVLRAKHHFLRLHGLARKVVIVDEVHAYETFTAEILARLCAWLRSLGATVVLLSATLASPQRARILAAYGVTEPLACPEYPRITIAQGGAARTSSFAARRAPVGVTIAWRDEVSLLGEVALAVAAGGCVAWIVNTVARAQATYKALCVMKASGLLAADVELSLLHARFPFAVRQARERATEEAFGPPEHAKSRPRAAILVGTQVLEQSLDLDFDLMVTDLAPVDLVIQRAGRLHRHKRKRRPEGLTKPQLWIAKPANEESPRGPDFGASAHVYDESVLLRTWLALRSKPSVNIPTEIEPLVEAVYAPVPAADLPAPLAAQLRALDTARENAHRSDTQSAEARELPGPEESDPFRAFTIRFADDEDPSVHEALRAVTRLGDASVSVVPVIERNGHLVLASDPSVTVRADAAELSFGEVIAIARQTLAISRKVIVKALLKEEPPPAFQRSGHLRHHRLLRLDAQAETVIEGTCIRLDADLGLVVGDLSPLAEPS